MTSPAALELTPPLFPQLPDHLPVYRRHRHQHFALHDRAVRRRQDRRFPHRALEPFRPRPTSTNHVPPPHAVGVPPHRPPRTHQAAHDRLGRLLSLYVHRRVRLSPSSKPTRRELTFSRRSQRLHRDRQAAEQDYGQPRLGRRRCHLLPVPMDECVAFRRLESTFSSWPSSSGSLPDVLPSPSCSLLRTYVEWHAMGGQC